MDNSTWPQKSRVVELINNNIDTRHRTFVGRALSGKPLHRIVYDRLKLPTYLFTSTKNTTRQTSFLQKYKRFLKSNDVLSVSFVRHPFER